MVKIYYNNLKGKSLKILDQFKKGSWIYVEDPSRSEIEMLAQNYDLEEDLLHDAIDIFEVPRMEVEDEKLYVFTRFAYIEDGQIQTCPVLIVRSDDFIMTISTLDLPFIKKFTESKLDFHTTLTTNLLFQILFQVNSTYNLYLNNISKKIRSISIQLEKLENRDIIQFVSFESVLNDFLSSLIPTSNILKNILTGKFIKLKEEDKDLLEDILLANNQLIEISQTNLRTIVNIREAYSTIMTNNLNRVIKLFTSLTVILTIPTMIASIYGMNVDLPFAHSPHIFSYIIAFLGIISVILLIIFYKRRWL
ncbi:MAG: hypothetical protein ACD_30C00052G0021 [uncultured bacterium]|uniref:Mg2 transporter protein CorA family protein n=4 Tax=Candidatus Daviesiibacteriota TaxID=1752718 RepID=A0A0G0HAU5_9BACT|nr:MAG: hypothetical protein ACD_30C00052G0021 [uncultured bacterium]KKQ09204.1 MAG: Mg2 transporter protein CorA family protein [Candidatus Daviesbacteria bacterium GW2011_GWB1_36_5]KKQ14802.1 MAG: Mg2 transporter protein CorA family protein [Candidatus Daviesbacteria bacterium GW2011_GWA1_36_8]OGE16437.1 MAG: hypothetical protein A2858_01735 [Candidatus Daviesbacteria bacterium RIFCSPHIGHO2_01_FULL_36_37]OGE35315.1 MAG: hypothetical protein A3E66_00460 [Candidatus Daviesbacteria bacterium RIF